MEPPGASDLHRGLIKASSDVGSSDGHDFLQFQQSGSTVWITIVIFIERLASRLIDTVGSSSNGRRKSINVITGRSRSDGHDALDLSLTLATHLDGWILIARTTIVVRSGPPTFLISIRWQTEDEQEPRSWCDRGSFEVKSRPRSSP